ncbi:MAG: sigma-70 family RNA polymerase sigma factor [Thermoanaerobaculia bacterium]|nr:sigma-70 family RNA polymerase sigma factor [Thermoanaerobaculia bacterium]
MNGTSDNDDLNCVRRCLDGETEAFGELVARYQTMVYNAAVHIVRDREDALEVSQAVFLKAFRSLDAFDQRRRFFSWIYRIAINDALNFAAARHPHEPMRPDLPSRLAGPVDMLEAKEAKEHVEAILGRLRPELRAAVVLRHFLDCSYHDAAEILGIPEKTFRSRLYEARQILRKELSALGYGPRGSANAGRQSR